jgi:hypothetical protein
MCPSKISNRLYKQSLFIFLQNVRMIFRRNPLRQYDTVARADNYFAAYRMLFTQHGGNERDIFEMERLFFAEVASMS